MSILFVTYLFNLLLSHFTFMHRYAGLLMRTSEEKLKVINQGQWVTVGGLSELNMVLRLIGGRVLATRLHSDC